MKIACAGANQFGNAAVDAGNKMANVLQENVAPALQQGVSDAAESANHLASSAKKSIFGSLLKEEIEAESFVLPKMINVVDASEKRTVDLEFGAIGWQSKEGKINASSYIRRCVGYCSLRFLSIRIVEVRPGFLCGPVESASLYQSF